MGKREEELTEEDVESLDENEVTEIDHDMNMRKLQYGFEQLREDGDSSVEERGSKQVKLSLNVGAFIRKAINKGRGNRIATYWTYKGSLTYPGITLIP